MVANVEIFPWNPNFETGIPLIDEQHKRLIGLLNLLVGHLAYQSDTPTLNAIFAELRDYTVVHFRAEEEIWGQHFAGDPWEEWHKHAHGDFISEILRIKEEENVKPLDDVIEDIVKFLTHWLAYHILESDKRMAKVVLALPTGMSLEQAKQVANDEMSGATKLLIETVMTMYDQMANRTVQLTREINRRKKAEEELQHARERADAANLAKSSFLANMSHEIRTPLNAITGMVYLMKRAGVTPEQAERLVKIDDAGKHLLNLINDILDLSKIEAGKFDLECKDTVVGAVLSNVASILGDRIREKNLELMVQNDVPPQALLGDPSRIQQALLNYAGNALKFTEQGGIILRAWKAEETFDTVLVRFEVQDTGIGIQPDAIERIFRDFEQADTSTTRQYGGTGLGLAITRKLAQLMGGSAGAQSVPGQGSTFWFTVRLKKGSATPQSSLTVPKGDAREMIARAYPGARVLIAEDEPINREITQMLLEDAGFDVQCVDNGAAAVDLARNERFALILMDVQMPEMDGLEATRRIRQMEDGSAIPIVALTANAFEEDRRRCVQAGMDDYLSKPVEPKALYTALLGWLNGTKQASKH